MGSWGARNRQGNVSNSDFDTARRGRGGAPRASSNLRARYRPYVVVCLLAVTILAGGAYYNSRVSEGAPKTVYSTSLDEAKAEAAAPLLVNINTADAKELDELPGVGPATAGNIVEHRRHRGNFRSVSELEEVKGIGPKTLEKMRPFATV